MTVRGRGKPTRHTTRPSLNVTSFLLTVRYWSAKCGFDTSRCDARKSAVSLHSLRLSAAGTQTSADSRATVCSSCGWCCRATKNGFVDNSSIDASMAGRATDGGASTRSAHAVDQAQAAKEVNTTPRVPLAHAPLDMATTPTDASATHTCEQERMAHLGRCRQHEEGTRTWPGC